MTDPLLLLPVRLETRFEGRTLIIRIYPDEIHLDRRSPVPAAGESRPRAPAKPRQLPDRWIAVGWRGGARFQVEGPPIREAELAVSPDPTAGDPERSTRWLVDLAEAERVGMALRLPLDEPHLDRLVVFGIRGGDATAGLVDLLGAHRDSDALGFVAPDAATNQLGAAAVAPAEPPPGRPDDRDGERLAHALGIGGAGGAVLTAAAGADRDEEGVARAMNTALWPATWGYYLASLVPGDDGAAPVVAPATIDRIRAHFIAHVRPGAPLGTLRIGAQPYGVLPITALDAWKPHVSDLAGMRELLQRLRTVWRAAAAAPSSAGDGQAMLERLGQRPSAAGYHARMGFGRHTIANLFAFQRLPEYANWRARQAELGEAGLRALGLAWRSRIAHAVFAEAGFAIHAPLVEAPRETALSPNYVDWVRTSSAAQLRAQIHTPRIRDHVPPGGGVIGGVTGGVIGPALASTAVPALHAADAPAVHAVGVPAGAVHAVDVAGDLRLDATLALGPRDSLFYLLLRHATLLAQLDAARRVLASAGHAVVGPHDPDLVGFGPLPAPSPWTMLDVRLPAITGAQALGDWLRTGTAADTAALDQHRAALGTLAHQPQGMLERCFTGTLDLCAYRLDAWITSAAIRRLAGLRAQRPTGLRIGGYGWLHDLAPRSQAAASEGYIAAPSPAHARAAAILRSGYRAHRSGTEPGALAIDLSSRRVRTALAVLDEVRAGRGLAEVLGRRFERALHDARLDPLLARLRTVAPASEGPVIDGLALLERWRPHRDLAGFDAGARHGDLMREIAALDDVLDAVSDVMLAEGVYQVVQGNPAAAAAAFDAIGRGQRPSPDIAVARTPRPAVRHTVCALIALPPASAAPAAGALAVRHAAAPELEAWATQFLPPLATVRARAEWRDAGGAVVAGADLTAADLGLSALDLVYLAGELDRWWRVPAGRRRPRSVADDATLVVTAGPGAGELRAAAAALRRLLTSARSARGDDLGATASPPAGTRLAALREALEHRIAAATASLDGDAAALQAALAGLAAFAIPGALTDGDVAALRTAAAAAIATGRQRLVEAGRASDDTAAAAALLDAALPLPVTLSIEATTRAALAARGELAAMDVADWLSAVGRVRAAIAELDDVVLRDQAREAPGRFAAAQLPHIVDEPLVFAAGAGPRDPRRLALVYSPLGARLGAPTASVAAITVDDWVEVVPVRELTAGIALHSERPDAHAPQSLVLAVPPDPDADWTPAAIEAVLVEALDLAALRMVPPEALGTLGQVLPAIVLADNAAGDTVSSDLVPLGAP